MDTRTFNPRTAYPPTCPTCPTRSHYTATYSAAG